MWALIHICDLLMHCEEVWVCDQVRCARRISLVPVVRGSGFNWDCFFFHCVIFVVYVCYGKYLLRWLFIDLDRRSWNPGVFWKESFVLSTLSSFQAGDESLQRHHKDTATRYGRLACLGMRSKVLLCEDILMTFTLFWMYISNKSIQIHSPGYKG